MFRCSVFPRKWFITSTFSSQYNFAINDVVCHKVEAVVSKIKKCTIFTPTPVGGGGEKKGRNVFLLPRNH